MAKRKRRNFTAEFKTEVVLEENLDRRKFPSGIVSAPQPQRRPTLKMEAALP